MPLSTIFQLYRGSQLIGGGNRSIRRKPLSHNVVVSYNFLLSVNHEIRNNCLACGIASRHNVCCILYRCTVKPVLRGHLWDKEKVTL